jgi:hypothetical protein
MREPACDQEPDWFFWLFVLVILTALGLWLVL